MEDSDAKLKQNQRAELRERFLRMFKCVQGKHLIIETYQGATVCGQFRSIDYNINNLHVSRLQTPIGTMPEALVRYADVLSIKFKM